MKDFHLKQLFCCLAFTGSLGATNFKLSKLNFGGAKRENLMQWNDIRTWIGRRQPQYAGLTVSYKPNKVFSVNCGPTLETESKRFHSFDGKIIIFKITAIFPQKTKEWVILLIYNDQFSLIKVPHKTGFSFLHIYWVWLVYVICGII